MDSKNWKNKDNPATTEKYASYPFPKGLDFPDPMLHTPEGYF